MKKGIADSVNRHRTAHVTDLPLFPLNVVLFPGITLPLHIFEPRYREMIDHCLEKKSPFGVLLIDKGREVGAPAIPHRVGTSAQIRRVKRHADGTMDIHVVGIQRFRAVDLDYSKSYLSAGVQQMPVINGATRSAALLATKVRPKLCEYVDLLAHAHSADHELGYIPHDPKTLAFLIGASMQISNETKQTLLELPGVPEMLAQELRLLSHEMQLIQHMVDTHESIVAMSGGNSGYLFPN